MHFNVSIGLLDLTFISQDHATGNAALNAFILWAEQILAPFTYNCGNFFFYVVGGKQFCREVALMVRCGKPPGEIITSVRSFR